MTQGTDHTKATPATRRGMTRRQGFGFAGALGAGYVATRAAGLGGGSGSGADGLGATAADAATCTVAPSLTEGPFWEDELLNRSDVTEDLTGIPLTLKLTVVDGDDDCSVYEGATVDIWHASPDGNYSDEPAGIGNDDTQGETWLRGYQVSDAGGGVTFKTLYPGFYSGRTDHIHVRVRTFDGSSTTYNFTTQIFFDESVNAAVYATSEYNSGNRNTTNDTDGIYEQGEAAGGLLLLTPQGSTSSGYTATGTVALTGLPAGSETPGGGGSNDDTVEATLKSTRFTERNGASHLQLKIKAEERISATAKLVRDGKVIAHKEINGLRGGGVRKLEIPLKRVSPGSASLKLVLEDKVGNRKTFSDLVQIPKAG